MGHMARGVGLVRIAEFDFVSPLTAWLGGGHGQKHGELNAKRKPTNIGAIVA